MKITVKEAIVVEKEVDFPSRCHLTKDDPHFQDVIDYLKTLKFLASGCSHEDFDSFPSYNQGGTNAYNLTGITVCDETNNKLVVNVWWYKDNSSYIIFEKP